MTVDDDWLTGLEFALMLDDAGIGYLDLVELDRLCGLGMLQHRQEQKSTHLVVQYYRLKVSMEMLVNELRANVAERALLRAGHTPEEFARRLGESDAALRARIKANLKDDLE